MIMDICHKMNNGKLGFKYQPEKKDPGTSPAFASVRKKYNSRMQASSCIIKINCQIDD